MLSRLCTWKSQFHISFEGPPERQGDVLDFQYEKMLQNPLFATVGSWLIKQPLLAGGEKASTPLKKTKSYRLIAHPDSQFQPNTPPWLCNAASNAEEESNDAHVPKHIEAAIVRTPPPPPSNDKLTRNKPDTHPCTRKAYQVWRPTVPSLTLHHLAAHIHTLSLLFCTAVLMITPFAPSIVTRILTGHI